MTGNIWLSKVGILPRGMKAHTSFTAYSAGHWPLVYRENGNGRTGEYWSGRNLISVSRLLRPVAILLQFICTDVGIFWIKIFATEKIPFCNMNDFPWIAVAPSQVSSSVITLDLIVLQLCLLFERNDKNIKNRQYVNDNSFLVTSSDWQRRLLQSYWYHWHLLKESPLQL